MAIKTSDLWHSTRPQVANQQLEIHCPRNPSFNHISAKCQLLLT